MPPQDQKDSPFFYSADVDTTNLKNSLSKAEKAYVKFSKNLGDVVQGLEDQSVVQNKVGEEAKKEATKQEKRQNRTFTLFKRLLSFRRGQARKEKAQRDKSEKEKDGILRRRLKKEKEALKDSGVSFGRLASLIGGGALVGGLIAAAKAYIHFDNKARELNVTLGAQPKLMAKARDMMVSYKGYLGLTSDEILQITKQMGELNLVIGDSKKSEKIFQSLFDDVVHLSKGMDVAAGSVVDMFDIFTRVYKLPHNRLRGIAASMKFIQENTAISGDELLNFAKNLDDVLTQMTKATKNQSADAKADLLAFAGIMKNLGVDPNKLSGIFSDALNIESDKGAEWLAFVTRQTGYGIEQMRKMIEKGDVTTPMMLMIRQLKKDGPEMIKTNRSYYQEMTGMSIGELIRLAKADESQIAKIIASNRKAMKVAEAHKKAALARQNAISRSWAAVKAVFTKIWKAVGKTVATVAEKLAKALIPTAKKMVGWFQKTSLWAQSKSGGLAITKWTQDAVAWISEKLWPAVKKVGKAFGWLGDKVKALINWWGTLSSAEKTAIGVGVGLIAVFVKMGPILGTLGGKVMAVVAALTALYVGAKKVADWVDKEQAKQIKGKGAVKATEQGMLAAARGTKAERVAFVRSEMKSKRGIITAGGKVNVSELQQRAIQAIPTPANWDYMSEAGKRQVLLARAALVAKWQQGANLLLSMTDMKEVAAAEERHKKMMGIKDKPKAATPPPAPRIPPPPTKLEPKTAPAPATPAMPKEMKTDDPKSQQLLGQIRDTLNNMNIRGAQTPLHPAEAVAKGALG